MRWIVLALLLVNGGFFAWQYYGAHGKHGTEQAELAKGDYPPLTLVSDLSPEQRTALGVTPKTGDAEAKPAQKTEQQTAAKTENKSAAISQPQSKSTEAKAAGATPAPSTSAKIETQPANPGSTSKQPKPANRSHCYALGPVGNHKLVKRIRMRVSSMGISVDQVRNEVEKVPTNWIYLGPYKSEAQAKRDLSRLHAKGIKDTQMITKGAKNYVISVGLFSTKPGADERLKRLQDAGFTPNISQVIAKKSHYWLDVSYKGGKAIKKKILSDMIRGIRGAGVKDVPCSPR